MYAGLDQDDRAVVDQVLSDWIVSEDPRRRFDAESLVDHFAIRAVLPAVRSARDALRNATGPSAPFDRAKIERIIRKLEGVPGV